MITLIISIISLVLALYIGFKRRVVYKTSKYLYLRDLSEDFPFIKDMYCELLIAGMYIISEKTTSILGKERTNHYLEFVFIENIKNKRIKINETR